MNVPNQSVDYLLGLLNEAPGDPTTDTASGEQQTTFTQTSTTYEPTEGDANIGGGMDDMGGDMGGMDDMGMDDPNAAGMDQQMGATSQPVVGDPLKKRKLFNNYKDLMDVMNKLADAATLFSPKNMSDDAKKIFFYINHKLEENLTKLNIIMTEQYANLSYQQLLSLFLYLKMSAKLYADMLGQLSVTYKDD